MKANILLAIVLSLGLMLVSSREAAAQSATNYTATNMWGTSPSGIAVPGAVDSAVAHNQEGAIAGEVNSAMNGALYNGGGLSTIYAIGSQTVISTSITGNNDSIGGVSATQTSSNSGGVSNAGQIGQTNTGNSN